MQGQTSENVAAKFKIPRKVQDEMAVASHAKALAAAKAGKFKDEIVPVEVTVDGKKVMFAEDDGPREGTTFDGLSKLKPAFSKSGTTTAGNSSQVSDGAAAVLLTTRKKAEELKLPILGRFRSYAVTGCAPELMGIGPAAAIPAALAKAELKVGDVDLYEINEAFASQATYCVQELGEQLAH